MTSLERWRLHDDFEEEKEDDAVAGFERHVTEIDCRVDAERPSRAFRSLRRRRVRNHLARASSGGEGEVDGSRCAADVDGDEVRSAVASEAHKRVDVIVHVRVLHVTGSERQLLAQAC